MFRWGKAYSCYLGKPLKKMKMGATILTSDGEFGKKLGRILKCCSWVVSYGSPNFTGLNCEKSYL